MNPLLARLWCLFLLCCWAPMAASTTRLTEADVRAVRQVVQAQLDAFAADDAERAFSYASASIQTQFGDAATFMAMVRSGYPMVVRPATVAFFLPHADDADGSSAAPVRQEALLRDREGHQWIATYFLERQPGNGWRISGCVVRADSGKSSV